MWVTCYADASYSKDDGGAWAVWLRCELGRVVRRGTCPEYVEDANAAELAAVYAGLYLAVSTWGARVRGVAVRSDSQTAIGLAHPESRPARKRSYRRLQEKVRAFLIEHALELDLRWVRGHQPLANGTSAFLNRQCDRLAKRTRLTAAEARAQRRRQRKKEKKRDARRRRRLARAEAAASEAYRGTEARTADPR